MSNRIFKVNSLLKEEISKIIQREVEFPPGTIITISSVNTSANLIEAKVHVSVFPEDKSEKILRILRKRIFAIQQQLNRKLKMRPTPKIIFLQDTVSSSASRVEEILEQLKNEEK